MLRRFRIATLSAVMTVAACKTSDKPAPPAPAPARTAAPAAKPTAPTAVPADPAAKPADPAPTAAVTRELQGKAVAMMQRMADMFAADGKDCEKLAADLKAFIADNKDLLSRLEAMEAQESSEERGAFLTRIASVQADVAVKMQGAMTACAANPSVLAAMKEFPAESH